MAKSGKREPINLGDYTLVSRAKYDRMNMKNYREKRGIPQRELTDEEFLTYYDRDGGLILKNGEVVPTGTFWSFEEGKPRNVKEDASEKQSTTKSSGSGTRKKTSRKKA